MLHLIARGGGGEGGDLNIGNKVVKLTLIRFESAFLLGLFCIGAFIFGVWVIVWVLSKHSNFFQQKTCKIDCNLVRE